jgi:hypothetical protein
MVDTCAIKRADPVATTVDPETGDITPAYTTVYTGNCRLKLPTAVARPLTVGEAQEFLQHPILSLPATTTGVEINDIVTITASALMPQLVGRVFHVRARPGQSHMTAARFEIMEVAG